jgi:hypothetical protein
MSPRILIYGTIAVPLLLADALLIGVLPGVVTRFYSAAELFPFLGGAAVYGIAHSFIRKPERMYLWGHEFTHLIVAKLFLKRVHGFHITSRDGGKVVIDGTNVWIDLAPYLFPFYGLLAMGAAAFLRPSPPWGTAGYLAAAGYLYALHTAFSMTGFVEGQPDLRRSGRFFSFALVLLFLAALVPLLLAPCAGGGWNRLGTIYGEWLESAGGAGRSLFLAGRSLLP